MLDRRVSGEPESVIEGGVEEGCESAGRQDHLRFRDTSGVIDVRGIFRQGHRDLKVEALPAMLLPRKLRISDSGKPRRSRPSNMISTPTMRPGGDGNRRKIDRNVKAVTSYVFNEPFGGGVRGSICQYRGCCMDYVYAELYGAARRIRSEPGEAVGVQV